MARVINKKKAKVLSKRRSGTKKQNLWVLQKGSKVQTTKGIAKVYHPKQAFWQPDEGLFWPRRILVS